MHRGRRRLAMKTRRVIGDHRRRVRSAITRGGWSCQRRAPVARSHAITPPASRSNAPTAIPPPIATAASDCESTPSGGRLVVPAHGARRGIDDRELVLVRDRDAIAVGRRRAERRARGDRGGGCERVSPFLGAGREVEPERDAVDHLHDHGARCDRRAAAYRLRRRDVPAPRAGRELERGHARGRAIAEIAADHDHEPAADRGGGLQRLAADRARPTRRRAAAPARRARARDDRRPRRAPANRRPPSRRSARRRPASPTSSRVVPARLSRSRRSTCTPGPSWSR